MHWINIHPNINGVRFEALGLIDEATNPNPLRFLWLGSESTVGQIQVAGDDDRIAVGESRESFARVVFFTIE